MRVAVSVGEGEEAGVGGVEAFERVGGSFGKVNDVHMRPLERSLRRAERRVKKLCDGNIELCYEQTTTPRQPELAAKKIFEIEKVSHADTETQRWQR
jgi:hypothetical protein